MFIIIEGPDRTGKSTLADALSEHGEVRHSGPPTRHPLQEYVLSLEDEVPENVIMDRWHVGEQVYPYLYPKGRKPLEPHQALWVELFLRSRGALLVSVAWDDDEVLERVKADKDSYLQPEDVHRCGDLFRIAFSRTILPKAMTLHKYPGGYDDLIDIARRVWELRAPFAKEFPEVIGDTLSPRFLLVGEIVGTPNPPEATHRMPFAPYPQASGAFLMQALDTWDSRDNVAIVNAYDSYRQPADLWSIWNELQRPLVVGLGKSAHQQLMAQSVPHGNVPHPQYVRRFYHNQLQRYSDFIRQAARTGINYGPEVFEGAVL